MGGKKTQFFQKLLSYRVFFSEDNPDLIAFNQFEHTFNQNDNFLFVLKPKSGTVAQKDFIAALEKVTELAWSIPYASRVDSIINFQHTRSDGDFLEISDLFQNASELTSVEISRRTDIALQEPVLAGQLIAHDAGAAGKDH